MSGFTNSRSKDMFKPIILPVACLALGAMQAASASSYEQGQWVTTFMGGTQLRSTDTLKSGISGSIADLGQLNPALAGAPAAADTKRLTMHDAYRAGPSLGIETGYMVTPNLEPFARLTFSQLRGRETRLGTLTSPALTTPGGIHADFDDQDAWALDVGAHFVVDSAGMVRPFLSGFVGAERTDAMRANLFIPGVADDLLPQTWLPQATRFNAGLEGGVTFEVSSQAAVNLSVGADYTAAHHDRSTALEALGIERVRLSDQHWAFPVEVGVNYRF